MWNILILLGVFGITANAEPMAPSSIRKSELRWNFGSGGERLFPWQSIKLSIPKEYQQKPIDWITIVHRQDEAHGWDVIHERDILPGKTAALIHETGAPYNRHHWRYWNGPSSGKWGAKFAELRGESFPETDNLYDFSGTGHCSQKRIGRDCGNARLMTDLVKVRALGWDKVYEHSFLIRFQAPANAKWVSLTCVRNYSETTCELPANTKVSHLRFSIGDSGGSDQIEKITRLNAKNRVTDTLTSNENIPDHGTFTLGFEEDDRLTEIGEKVSFKIDGSSAPSEIEVATEK